MAEIKWEKDFNAALRMAKEAKRPIYLDFWFEGSVTERHPEAGATPEAVFLLGVAEYWKTHDVKALRRAHDTLTSKYTASEWARRAVPYGVIPL